MDNFFTEIFSNDFNVQTAKSLESTLFIDFRKGFALFQCPAEPARQLLTEIMLADRWVCSVERLQRWRTVGEGPQYLKIVGKVLYRLKDIEAYEEACLIRKVL